MTRTSKLLIGAAAMLFSYATLAQSASGPGACGKARDPQRCEALQKAKEACKDKSPADKRKCMMESMPPMDCGKARSPERCEAMEKAKVACKDKSGRDYAQCLRQQAPRRGARGAK